MKLTEREKAYHDGYEQGRFDEYAERMGYDQAEKVKAKIDKQKNCPYCHEMMDLLPAIPSAEPITGDFNDIGCGLINEDGDWYMSSWDFDVMKVANNPAITCPMCGRDLSSWDFDVIKVANNPAITCPMCGRDLRSDGE